MERLEVIKTYKIYSGGSFPRTESGRYYFLKNKSGKSVANICLCSKKDVKNAVVAARKAISSWSNKTAFNRGQILYRIAEMLEGRKSQFIDELVLQGVSVEDAKVEVELSIDRIVYYVGWCDKINQISGSINSVSSSHFNYSKFESIGVVGVIADDTTSLIGLISQVIPIILSGNTCVVLASEQLPLCAVTFAEVLHSSDVPGGVVNILTGSPEEMATTLASHLDVNALLIGTNTLTNTQQLKENSGLNVKLVKDFQKDWKQESSQGLYYITDFMTLKTIWHPVDKDGNNGNAY